MASKFEHAVEDMRAGLATAAEGGRLMHEAAEKYADAEHLLAEAGAGSGSGNEKIVASTRHLTAVQEALGRAYEHLEAGREVLGEYLSLIGADGVLGHGTGTSAAASADARREQVRLEDFSPKRPHGGAVAAIRDLGWHTNEAGKVSARGNLYGADGTQLNEKALKA
ncbi:hypothetical protein [Phytomonospora endophytica]|uniref:Uncharacterized protein n=1 Tax=Phytomonospora endophytica TaxID=714109 RepID=A0A841FZ27_9ACTN|nr:hypothetical protein [Phytomonospora endophytica]MBB6039993.1 hypothetical protein [Phytomonospora endophytica]GIG71542.1 hypothetical protein Pen01_78370 [Phytomonospora endophytica]